MDAIEYIIILGIILVFCIYVNWLHKKINHFEDRVWGLTRHMNEHVRDFRIHHNTKAN